MPLPDRILAALARGPLSPAALRDRFGTGAFAAMDQLIRSGRATLARGRIQAR